MLGENSGEVFRWLWLKINRWDALWLIVLFLVILVILESDGLLLLILRSTSQGGLRADAYERLRKLWVNFFRAFF